MRRPRTRCSLILLVLATSVACRSSNGDDSTSRGPQSTATVSVDDRDQYRLASLIDDARASKTPKTTLERLRQDWLGKRVIWEVGYTAALCRAEGPCVALPFDHARRRSSRPQGWLPRLKLTENQRSALRRQCGALEGQCVFSFEGTLDRFELGPERATALRFAQVEVGSVRAARPAESWVRRSPRTKSTPAPEPHAALSRIGLAGGERR